MRPLASKDGAADLPVPIPSEDQLLHELVDIGLALRVQALREQDALGSDA